ncbi:MAG: hypothetical protein KKD38_07090, partial [Candidatus Delongbacteria bacterium]|nr:hypothetical protein [Candidatus Delongbacteria bacterium]
LLEYSDILKNKGDKNEDIEDKRDFNSNYEDKDPRISKVLNDLNFSVNEYKEKMESISKLVDEDHENYDYLVDFAKARFKYGAAAAKKEILYYSKKSKEEPNNEKYSQNLRSYREEILKLEKDLIEDLNTIKNEYY